MKILRHSGTGVAGIFFPIGKPPQGTCQYATEKCLKKCYALDKDYDEKVNIPESVKKDILKFFMGNPIITVCNEIMKEMDELQATILSWFTSGDCLDKYVDRIFRIMMLLQEEGVIQNGFTRNNDLYHKILRDKKANYDILRIILTVESLEIQHAPSCSQNYPKGIWAVPDYDKGIARLYHGRLGYKTYAGCGFHSVIHEFEGQAIEIATNCFGCFKKKIGCFLEIK